MVSKFKGTPGGQKSDFTQVQQTSVNEFSYEVLPDTMGTWGYEIFQGEKKVIRQLTIPALPGNMGLPDSLTACRFAEEVIGLLTDGVFPPTLSAEKVQSLLQVKENP